MEGKERMKSERGEGDRKASRREFKSPRLPNVVTRIVKAIRK